MSWELQRHPRFGGVRGPVVVCVMDGVGIEAVVPAVEQSLEDMFLELTGKE